MKKLATLLFAFGLVLTAVETRADVLLLAHGYLSHASTWEASGVARILERDRWKRTGILITAPMGRIRVIPATSTPRANPNPNQITTEPKNKLFLAELPTTAPLGIQANHLQAMLWFLAKRYPQEKMILVGHSVGGVVARLTLVRSKIPSVRALITIASPHLGTPLAEEALDATDDPWPVEVVKDFFTGDNYQILKYSRGLYIDIVQPRPGSLLFWLNGQPHPNITYVSIVRTQPFNLWGDRLVPGTSQNMNNVPALAGRSALYTTASGHALNPGDGILLARILKRLK